MKKLISICLLIALLVNLFPVLSFADDVLDEAYFEKVRLMDALNVLDANSAPSPDTKVTRGDFVKYLLNLLDKDHFYLLKSKLGCCQLVNQVEE